MQLKIYFPTEKAIMDGIGVGRPAHESHLIHNVAETLYIWNEQVAGKNTAPIKPKREIIKMNKNLKFSCLSVLEEKQIFIWEDEEMSENCDGEGCVMKEFRSWWLLKN